MILKSPYHFLALGFGAGLSPYAPGTVGTLAAIPPVVLLSLLGWEAYLAATLIVLGAGIIICDKVRRDIGEEDPACIVWDEIGGFMVTMLFVPLSVASITAGFILFRMFDILKPWPIRAIEYKIKGGAGIMLDDIMAGFFSWIILKLLLLVDIL